MSFLTHPASPAVLVTGVLVLTCARSLRRHPYSGWNLALFAMTGIAATVCLWVLVLAVFHVPADRALTAWVVFLGVLLALGIIGLFANSVVMLRREGRTLANLLSFLLAAALTVLGAILAVAVHWNIRWLEGLCGPLLVATAYVLVTLVAFVVHDAVVTRLRPRRPADAVIVLGSGLIGGRVPPLLARRLDAGLSEWRRAAAARSIPPLLIPSGGQGADEPRPEGVAMAEYLMEQDAEAEPSIRVEDRSRTTRENLVFSRALMPGGNAPVVVATSDYHVLRAGRLAAELGMDAFVVGAPTARYYLPSAVLRSMSPRWCRRSGCTRRCWRFSW